MSWTFLKQPSEQASIYQKGAMLYELAFQLDFTSTANDGGNQQLGLVDASAVAVGELVYVDALETANNVDTAVVEVLAKSGNSITIDVPFDGGFPSEGVVRTTEQVFFTIESGFTNVNTQPQRTFSLQQRANPKGVYQVNTRRNAIARLDFTQNPLGANRAYNHMTQIGVYPTGSAGLIETTLAYKHTQGVTPAEFIAYQGRLSLISLISPTGNKPYDIFKESPAQQTLTNPAPGSYNLNIKAVAGKEYRVNLSDSLLDEFTSLNPPSADWYELLTANSGQTITGVIFKPTEAGNLDFEAEEDNTGVVTNVVITIDTIEALELRPACNGLYLFWWHPQGGWVSYVFDLRIDKATTGGDPILAKGGNQVVRAIDYPDQHETLSLIARPESQLVHDYLNTLFDTAEIWASNADLTEWTRYFLDINEKQTKRTQPYLLTSNEFTVQLIKSETNDRINEAR